MNAYDIGMLESKYLPDKNIQRLQIIAKQDKNIINVVGEPPTKFTPDARLHLLKVSFEFVRRFYNIIQTKNKWDENVNQFHKYGSFCSFTKAAMERVITSLVVIIYELHEHIEFKKANPNSQQDFAFDRLGTHPLENLNGDIRNVSKGNDTIIRASSIVSKAHLLKLLSKELNLPNIHRGRVNTGGVRLSQCLNRLGIPETNVSASILADSIFAAADSLSEETFLSGTIDADAVSSFFKYITKANQMSHELNTLPKLNAPDGTKNQSILTKLFGYH